MSDNFFNGRIQQLRDTQANWNLVANTFIPLEGEACIVLDGVNKGRVKYGDGVHVWGSLPYVDADTDNKSLSTKAGRVIQLNGYEEASNGQSPSKTSNGFEWITPVKQVIIGEGEPVQPTSSGSLIIPIAGENLGLVKESGEIGIGVDGEISVKEVSADKVMYDEDNSIKDVLNQRTSWEEF